VGGNLWNERVAIDGVVQQDSVNINSVGAGYLRLFDIALMAGRDFDARDTTASPRVAIVTESFAKKYFPGRSVIGQTFTFERTPDQPNPPTEIVGVAADTKYADLREAFLPLIYLAATQEGDPGPYLRVAVRAAASTAAIAPAVTSAAAEVSPAITIQYQTVRELVRGSVLRERLMATLSAFFGGLALLIATIGLYGVMSYMVQRRRVEIGVRMALGADAASVVRLIVREAGVLLALGLDVGLGLSLYASRTAETFLFGLKPNDPLTLAVASVTLASVALAASWLPARRASRVAPTVALREE